MAEQIDELYVRLGLESDAQQFQQAEAQFGSLQSTVLQMGAVIGGGLGFQALTADIAETIGQINKLSDEYQGVGVTPSLVSNLRGAFRLINEEASEADSTIRSMADLLEDVDWGQISDQAYARGFDASGLQEAETAVEVMTALNEQMRQMDERPARELGQALGMNSAQIRMFRDFDIGGQMAQSAALNPLTEEMSEAAREFNQGWGELALSMDGLRREISESFIGDLGTGMSDMAEAISENREAIDEFREAATPALTGMAASLGAMVAFRAARAGLGALSNVPGLTLAAGVVGGELYDRLSGDESITDDRDVGMHGPPREGGIDKPRPDTPVLFDAPAWMEDMRTNRGTSEGGAQWGPNYEVHIDARGATNPEEVRRAGEEGARRVLEESANNAREDTKSEAQ